MELTSTPQKTDRDDKAGPGKGGLVWDPAGPEVDKRLGPRQQAVVDYLLHPPPGYAVPGSGHSVGLTRDRRAALDTLIKMAFEP